MRQHVVPPGVRDVPLKTYLTRAFPTLPGWLVRETLKKRDVRVNGVKQDAQARVSSGDELAIYIDDRYFAAPLDIIYQDDELIVADKPAGVPVDLDDRQIGEDTMLRRIQAACPQARLCHRLDTYTGGVLIAAKNEAVCRRMEEIFRRHELRKLYQCVVVGHPARREERLTAWLEKDARQARVRVIDQAAAGALPIETRYRLVKERGELSLLEVELITGRTHQIRAHLAHVGLPLLGDDKYGNREANRRMKLTQPLLWCTRIEALGRTFESVPRFASCGFEE